MNQENQTEAEIDLIDYIGVIIKRKKFIFIVFLIGLIGGGVLTFLLPYKVETSLEIGKLDGAGKSEINLLELPAQLVDKIKSGVYGDYPGIKVDNPRDTNLVKIKISSNNLEEAKKKLENINNLILTEHNNKIKHRKDNLEAMIEKLKEDIDFFISKDQESAGLNSEIYKIQQRILAFQPTQVVQEPFSFKKEKKLVVNLFVGAIPGIFIGIFLAFCKEWWNRNKFLIFK